MKESVPHLTFAVLFAIAITSIGMSVRPMLLLAAQLPPARAQHAPVSPRQPVPTPRKLAVTPVPTVANPRVPTARLSS